jgi:hypothetical protein
MASVNAAEALAGLALIFFLPGFGIARATFPEWRFRGPDGTVRLLETLTVSLFGSVGVTVVVGFGLLNSSIGFGAMWSNPTLFEALAGLTAVALVIAFVRGAFSRVPPVGPAREAESPDPFEAIGELERLNAEERRLRHRLRVVSRDDPGRARLQADLDGILDQQGRVVATREAELNAL